MRKLPRSGRMVLALGALVACGGPDTATATATKPARAAPATLQPRTALPPALATLVPRHGILAAGGGLVSPAWRVVIDIDANTVFGGTMDDSNSSATGPMDHESRRALTPRNRSHLMQMAHAAWAEPAPTTTSEPTADYDEMLVVADGDQVFYLEGFGPIRRPLAAAAIVEVRAAAGL